MLTRRTAMMGAALAALVLAAPALAQELNLPRQKVELVAPPFVHPHEQATKQGPKIVEFRMEIEEKEVVIDERGTRFHAMTFNGSMPGPLMVVHEGDYVELTLVNPESNMMPHNIVFVTPGARKEIAQAAETMRPEKLDGQGRAYVPASDKIFN